MRSGRGYWLVVLGLVVLAVFVGWFAVRDRDETVTVKVSGEAVDGRAAELVSVEYPGGAGSLKVRLRTRSVDFNVDELTVSMSSFVLSPSGLKVDCSTWNSRCL